MIDGLAVFWRHSTTIRRYEGEGTSGPILGAPVTERCHVADKTQVVRDASGKETTSSTSVAYPPDVARIPPDSEVTLPAEFGGRTARVIAVAIAAMGPPFPDHQLVYLE